MIRVSIIKMNYYFQRVAVDLVGWRDDLDLFLKNRTDATQNRGQWKEGGLCPAQGHNRLIINKYIILHILGIFNSS